MACTAAAALTIALYALGAAEGRDFTSYDEMRARFGELYRNGEYEEGARLLEEALELYPDHLFANAYNLAVVYGRLGRCERGDCIRGLEAYQQRFRRGERDFQSGSNGHQLRRYLGSRGDDLLLLGEGQE